MGPAGARHYAHTDRSADVGTCLTTPRGVVVSGAASLYGRQYRGWVLPAVSRGRGSGTVAVAGKGAGGPHAVSTMDRAGATDSYRGGEGDGARGVAYGAISRSGSLFLGTPAPAAVFIESHPTRVSPLIRGILAAPACDSPRYRCHSHPLALVLISHDPAAPRGCSTFVRFSITLPITNRRPPVLGVHSLKRGRHLGQRRIHDGLDLPDGMPMGTSASGVTAVNIIA